MPDPTITAYRELEPDDLLTALIRRKYPPAPATIESDRSDRCWVLHEGYVCTRAPNHDGPHVAHVDDEPVAVWPQEGADGI